MSKTVLNYLRHTAYAACGIDSLAHPLMAYVYLTYRCNLRCSYCDDGTGCAYPTRNVDQELSTSEVKRLLQIIRVETDGLILTGGDPLVRNDLPEILAHARALGFSTISVCTNGLLLDQQVAILHNIDILMLSFDTLDESKSESLYRRGPQVIGKVRENLERLLLPRGNRPRTYLSICITPETLGDVPAVIDYALERDLGFTFTPVLRGAFIDSALAASQAYRDILDWAIELKGQGAPILGSMGFLKGLRDLSHFTCRPTLLMRVKPNGALLYPCNKLNLEGGNLLKLGSYQAAVEQGFRDHGGIPKCGTQCHEGCYMDISLAVERPSLMVQEIYLRAKGLVRRRRSVAHLG